MHDVPAPPWGRPAWGRPPWARGPWGGPPYRHRRGRGVGLAAWLLLVQLGGALLAHGHEHRRALDGLGVALLVVVSVAPARSVRWTRTVLAVVVAATATYYGLGYPGGPVFLGLVVVVVVAAVRGARVLAWLLLATGLAGSVLLARALDGSWPPWPETARHLVGAVVVGLLGELARERTARFAEMRRGFEEGSRRRASDERLRLAQDLHDVLAHDVSLIHVQASTALHLFDDDPQRARAALAAIKDVSHETLQELRATVGALRAEGDAAPLRPASGLADLDELAERSTAAGLRVVVRRDGVARDLPARVELTAYRVAQEAVTNARRHSGASSAEITVRYDEEWLEVEVTDAGRGRPNGSPDGHGLTGMRERVGSLGGTVRTEPGPHGGFRVVARIPLRGPEPG